MLGAAFSAAFARSPTRFARAPGRVNLIGEHTDYNGLSVFPMALRRGVSVAYAPRDDARVRLASTDPLRFAPREFAIRADIAPSERGDWSNYAKAAAQALARRSPLLCGIDALVDGDLPIAAGLSSSSAMLVAVLLALGEANGIDVPREELMELAASAERYVGVESGGMDQAISLGGRAGHALVIEFGPLALQPVAIPRGWSFVVADSLVGAEKSGRARDAYNARVRECKAALARVREARAEWPTSWRGLVERVDERELFTTAERVLDATLVRRFRHVVTEGRRVHAARDAMLADDPARFGELMDASHASLRDDYEVSCPELDALVAIARDAGAHGARLTGAGFGGCIVASCARERRTDVIEAIRERFLAPRGRRDDPDAVFEAEAADGASLEPA